MIFVFGSNLDGNHAGGAALYALKHKGAVMGRAEGFMGQSYAIPTVGHSFARMPLEEIERGIEKFLHFAKHSEARFALTPIGCGIAGHKKADIWAILEKYGVPPNVYLTSTWVTE